jgi:hypothetical protein
MQDRGFKHNKPDNINVCMDYLNKEHYIGAVSIAKPYTPIHHIDIGCMIWRSSLLSKMTWKYWIEESNRCPCIDTKKEIEELGFQISYYPTRKWLTTRV